MRLFKSFTLTWWQGSLLKISMVSLGIVVGATWPDVLAPARPLFSCLFLLPAAYVTHVWWRQ